MGYFISIMNTNLIWREWGRFRSCAQHGTYNRWELRICCARMKKNRSFRRKDYPNLCLLSIWSKVLNKSNNRDWFLRAHLFPIYYLIKVPWFYTNKLIGKYFAYSFADWFVATWRITRKSLFQFINIYIFILVLLIFLLTI